MKKVYKIGTVNSIKTDYGLFKSLVDGSLLEVTAEQLEGVDNIRQNAFHYHSSIANITIPDSVTSIGNEAFSRCSKLINVTIGNGVTSIDARAFSYCTSLTNVTIGNSVTSIGFYAFTNCSSLTRVIINAILPPTIQSNTFQSCSSLNHIIVPKGSGEAYKSATNWSAYADIIKEAAE